MVREVYYGARPGAHGTPVLDGEAPDGSGQSCVRPRLQRCRRSGAVRRSAGLLGLLPAHHGGIKRKENGGSEMVRRFWFWIMIQSPQSDEDMKMAVQEQLYTAADLLALPHDRMRYELVEGHLLEMSPTGKTHGQLTSEMTYLLDAFVRQHK